MTSLFGGRVIAVQVYPHYHETTGAPVMEGVAINGREVLGAKIDGARERVAMLPG